jgi:hypothetical protein
MMRLVSLILVLLSLISCGGGSGGDSPPPQQPINQSPSITAESDRIVGEEVEVIISSTASDPENSNLTFSWKQTSGVNVVLSNTDSLQASFVAPEVMQEEVLVFEVTVTDSGGLTDSDTLEIRVINRVKIEDIREQLTDDIFASCIDDTKYTDEVTYIDCHNKGVISISGVENFTNLLNLYMHSNLITEVDLSKNIKLWKIDLARNQLTSINVSENVLLEDLRLHENDLSFLDVFNNPKLTNLAISKNQIDSIDISNNTLLERVNFRNNNIVSINTSLNPNLEGFSGSGNSLEHVDVSQNEKLLIFGLAFNNISSVDLSFNEALKAIALSEMPQLEEIDLTKNTKLESLSVDSTSVSELDVSNNIIITSLTARYAKLTSVPAGLSNISYKDAFIDLRFNPFTEEALDELRELKATFKNLLF